MWSVGQQSYDISMEHKEDFLTSYKGKLREGAIELYLNGKWTSLILNGKEWEEWEDTFLFPVMVGSVIQTNFSIENNWKKNLDKELL